MKKRISSVLTHPATAKREVFRSSLDLECILPDEESCSSSGGVVVVAIRTDALLWSFGVASWPVLSPDILGCIDILLKASLLYTTAFENVYKEKPRHVLEWHVEFIP